MSLQVPSKLEEKRQRFASNASDMGLKIPTKDGAKKQTDSTNFGSMTIDTFVDNTNAASRAIIREAYIPQEATALERRLHSYLDTQAAFSIDVKMKMQEENADMGKSPLVINALRAQKKQSSLAQKKGISLGTFNSDLKQLQLN